MMLHVRKALAVKSLSMGASISQAARDAGVARSTLHVWMRESEMQEALARAAARRVEAVAVQSADAGLTTLAMVEQEIEGSRARLAVAPDPKSRTSEAQLLMRALELRARLMGEVGADVDVNVGVQVATMQKEHEAALERLWQAFAGEPAMLDRLAKALLAAPGSASPSAAGGYC